MSDAKIIELESKIGDVENELGIVASDKEDAENTIAECEARRLQLEDALEVLTDQVNHEPFDEPV